MHLRIKRFQTQSLVAFLFVLVALVTFVCCGSKAAAQEALKYWPQWRGPLANGVAPQGNPPTTWGEGQNIKWKVPCPGGGSASPIVWGDKIFILAAVATDKPAPAAPEQTAASESGSTRPRPEGSAQEPSAKGPAAGGGPGKGKRGMPQPVKPTVYYRFDVVCLDRQTGAILWQRTAHEEVPHEGFKRGDGGYACFSPVTDGKNVYAYFGSRGLYCYDCDGNRKWEKQLSKMNIVAEFGEGGSPALYGDTLIVNRDHENGSHILAINKTTGETLWQAKRDEPTSWSTPLVIDYQGKVQAIVSATNRVRSYELATGKVIWECGGQTRNVIPSPVVGFDMIFATSGYRGNALQAIALGQSSDLTGSDAVRWHVDRGTPYVPSPLLFGDKLYVLSNNNAVLSCYQAETGTVNFSQTRLEGLANVYASPVGAADRVYLFDRNGKAVVLKCSKDLEVLATNTLGEGFDASPAIVDNEMLLRGKEHLYCIRQNY